MRTLFLFIFLMSAHLLKGQIITTIAGNSTPGFSGENGPATVAAISGVIGIAVDKIGNIYFSEAINNVVEKIDTNGILTRFAGTGVPGSGGDGGPATNAELNFGIVGGLAVDSIGNVFISTSSTIRKVNTSGIISTIAGTAVYGYSGDGGPATNAEFADPVGICFDKAGNFYIADDQNSDIRMINVAGIASTFAGTTIGFSGDGGPATNAQFKWPEGISIDDRGNMYISDLYTGRIRKIDTSGIITTIAGGDTSFPHIVCEGCPATSLQLNGPIGVAVDHSNNVYTSVNSNHVIQKITPSGVAYTIAGNGTPGYSGDGGPASAAMLNGPKMICLDNSGNLLITDAGNHRLRKVWIGTNYIPPVNHFYAPQFSIYPNPVIHNEVTCSITTDTNEDATIIITNIIGQVVYRAGFTTNTPFVIPIEEPPGLYFVTATIVGEKFKAKLVVE